MGSGRDAIGDVECAGPAVPAVRGDGLGAREGRRSATWERSVIPPEAVENLERGWVQLLSELHPRTRFVMDRNDVVNEELAERGSIAVHLRNEEAP